MRRENDYYPTPRWATAHLLSHLPFAITDPWVEPCVGSGDIADMVEQAGYAGFRNDLDCEHDADFYGDATDPETWDVFELFMGARPAWCITNPPFNQASQILPLAMERCTKGVIMLLPLSYLEPCANRGQWLEQHQDRMSIVFLPKRASFTGDGNTAMVATAWFIWGKHRRLMDPFVYPSAGKQLSLLEVA
jgi:hypothetical protein